MKKGILILVLAVLIFSCSKRMAPSANNDANTMNEKVLATTTKANTNQNAASDKPVTNTNTNTNVDVASQSSRTATKEGVKLSPEQIGQSIYSTKCGKCHGLKVTTDYTVERWMTVMQVMAIKANLNDEEKQNVVAYVRANAKK